MTSVGICASVVSGAKILVRDRLLKVPENRGVVIPGCGRGYQSGGRRPIDEPTDRLTLQSHCRVTGNKVFLRSGPKCSLTPHELDYLIIYLII